MGWRESLITFTEDAGRAPIILVDMDNTLVDWDKQFYRIMQLFHPEIPLVSPRNRTDFYIQNCYPEEHRECITHVVEHPNFWLDMDPTPYSIEALKEMQNMGLHVYIVTTPDRVYTARCAHEKLDWVERHLGIEWKSRTILTAEKTLVRGDVLIDDRPGASLGLLKPSWSHILYQQPYNHNSCDCPLLSSWKQWGEVIYKALLDRHMTAVAEATAAAAAVGTAIDPLPLQARNIQRRYSRGECCGAARLGSPFPSRAR